MYENAFSRESQDQRMLNTNTPFDHPINKKSPTHRLFLCLKPSTQQQSSKLQSVTLPSTHFLPT